MSSITTSMVRLKSLGSEYTVQVFMLRKFLKDCVYAQAASVRNEVPIKSSTTIVVAAAAAA
eukprot:14051-Amphidinium_carterae.1